MVGIRRTSGKYPYKPTKKEMHMVDMFNIGKERRRILEEFEYGLSVPDIAYQNDILKKASKEWIELNEAVTKLKEEEK